MFYSAQSLTLSKMALFSRPAPSSLIQINRSIPSFSLTKRISFSKFFHFKRILQASLRSGQTMATQPKEEDVSQTADSQQEATHMTVGWGGKIEEQYRKIKEHAETYPYVWGSYILVYGGFGLWLTYRWRKLRKTEDRVRGLQERLRKLVEAEQLTNSVSAKEQSTNSSSVTNKGPPSADK